MNSSEDAELAGCGVREMLSSGDVEFGGYRVVQDIGSYHTPGIECGAC